MPELLWFNDSTPRRIKLRSAAVLVGKAPTKQKRIKMMATMQLDSGGENQITGLPDWLEASRDFVMKNGETVTAGHTVRGVNLTMGDANLFRNTPTEAPGTQLDHFQVKQMGNSEDPDTVVTFEMRTQFSTDLWGWCGQQSGEEFDAAFDIPGETPTSETGTVLLTSPADAPADDTEEDDTEEDDASEDEPEDYETARAEACKPEHDVEFGQEAPKPKGRGKAQRAETPPEPTPEVVADAKHRLAIM